MLFLCVTRKTYGKTGDSFLFRNNPKDDVMVRFIFKLIIYLNKNKTQNNFYCQNNINLNWFIFREKQHSEANLNKRIATYRILQPDDVTTFILQKSTKFITILIYPFKNICRCTICHCMIHINVTVKYFTTVQKW